MDKEILTFGEPLHIILPKTSGSVKSYDGQTK